jgi:carbon-monoxide dehydrogenase iron sulfur subunit
MESAPESAPESATDAGMDGAMGAWVVMADADKCRACRKCELACIASHNNLSLKEAAKALKLGIFAPRVHVVKTGEVKMPVQCHQCEHAPCARVCPTGALVQENGRVRMRPQFCAACSLCIMACPYGAISLSYFGLPEADEAGHLHGREIAVRCDLCEDWRRREGKSVSACVEACPSKALRLVHLDG